MVIGTPCSGPSFLPALTALSAALARLRAAGDVGGDDGVEGRIVRLDALQIEIEQFEAADFLLPDRRGELLGGLEGQSEGHGRGFRSGDGRWYRPYHIVPAAVKKLPAQ